MRRPLLVLTVMLVALSPIGAAGHDYGEFSPLPAQLRTALIDVLARTAATGDLTREPPETRTASDDAPADLASLLDHLDHAALARLAERLRRRAGVEDRARLSDGTLLPLFYDLAEFETHFAAHGADGGHDPAARADFRRLREIVNGTGQR